MVEIKIISGTKDEPPNGHNTRIYVDGKEEGLFLTYFWFRVEAGEFAEYCMGSTNKQLHKTTNNKIKDYTKRLLRRKTLRKFFGRRKQK